MKILLDAMGGDNAPDANIKGALNAINKIKAEVILIGKEEIIRKKIKEFTGKEIEEVSDRLKIRNATETIEMTDTPTVAIKHKKDSSMVVGFKMLKEGEGDVFISAGNSGALLTGATLLVGRIKGIDRPALAGILPAYKSQLLLIDAGSNTNCKPINLLQFAQMSSIYLKNTYGIEKPTIGLLNIGTEETKGNELVKESYKLLKEKSEELDINFVGNVEGRDAFSGKINAIVTDGFTGNVFLKTTEGLGKFVKRSLTESFTKNLLSKILSIPALPAIKRFSKVMDYKSYGGALFLGVKKPVVKAHGSSDSLLFEYTLIQAEKFVENKAVDKMIEEFEKQRDKEEINKN
ncbi:MAG: phosphate acyltransferase PlsX [Clostridia bacterium]|nr:phosphate acyltransferase PlsX [Clostridium sp.]MBS6253010.1 phosphate acyltransferase PlsX [Clostridium sp.]